MVLQQSCFHDGKFTAERASMIFEIANSPSYYDDLVADISFYINTAMDTVTRPFNPSKYVDQSYRS